MKRQGVYAIRQFVRQYSVDRTVPLKKLLLNKTLGHQHHSKVAFRIGRHIVLVALVVNFKVMGSE